LWLPQPDRQSAPPRSASHLREADLSATTETQFPPAVVDAAAVKVKVLPGLMMTRLGR